MIYKTIAKCPHRGQEHEVEVEVIRGHLAETDIATMTNDELKRAAASERSRMSRAGETQSARMDEINTEYDKREYKRRQALAMLESLDEE